MLGEKKRENKKRGKLAAQDRGRQLDVFLEISAENIEVPSPEVPVEGLPLKTVSTFMLVLAISCLAAFLAGRTNLPEKIASDSTAGTTALVAAPAFTDPSILHARR